ncbi:MULTISPECIES: helix-turn-helix domain-containing protein [Pseudomonadota]|uniref:Helix-turn-helix domain-containing protein n=1 Tax=Aromatoleum bremense TaxID=76115 RepID=A0ABX1P1D3_9RHOO|nr:MULTISPECIES: helix-turn-helix transcriptional regulator [Pseudomonadaceae]NMG17722.1 helix-turn-helix domain-containing protein [Aromatoleum bremense]PJX11659.1 XRE family transcriptional regulator [Pseudomonas putida]HBN9751888.1 helix-turn-helix transcriptional regulator [Pseudomonas aeruginosa]
MARALKTVRKARGLSQEAFSDVSSRTYMSTLERDLKSPTISKLDELCEVMEVHPLTLLTLAYAGDSTRKTDQLLAQVRQELEAVLKERDTP